MLTILNDPSGISGRVRYDWDLALSMQKNIELHLPAGGECLLFINGAQVDPVLDDRLDKRPTLFDHATVVRRPAGYEAIVYLVIAVIAAIVAVALMPTPPTPDSTGKDSPNNSLTSQSNIARAYQAIPDVYGYRRVWPDLIQPSTVEYINQVKFVTEWLCISRGVGTISNIQYAETPIDDIAGASYEVFEPTSDGGYLENSTTTITDVVETFASEEVNGQELVYAAPFPSLSIAGAYSATSGATSFTATFADGSNLDKLKSLAPSGTAMVSFTHTGGPFSQTCTVLGYIVASGNCTFTFSSTAWGITTSGSATFAIVPNGVSYTINGPYTLPVECSRIRWNTVFLRGLKATVYIRAEWWQIDADGVEIPGTREYQQNIYTADTYDQCFYTNEVIPAAGYGRYRAQFYREGGQGNAEGIDIAKLEELYAVRHYPTKVLPGVTVIRITTRATLAATGFSDRKFNVRFLRHVRTLTDDSISPSRNFARSMAHIWTLAGNDIADLDTDALTALNDQHGEDSPLLRFDGSLDDADVSLGERLQLLADSARCVVWRDGLKWTVTRDQAKAYPELQLDYRNLAAGGESSIGYASHLPASNDGIEVEYVDEVGQAKKAYVRLNIESGTPTVGISSNPKKIKMIGCATVEQAENRAHFEARKLLYQRVTVNDTALSDGGLLGIGSLVRWIDPNDFAGDEGLQAGEVLSLSGDLIETSETLEWGGQTEGRILFTGVDGLHLGAPVVCYPAAGNKVQLSSVPDGIYLADGDRQLGSRYAFAVGLTEAEMEASGLYLVTEVKPAADGTTSLALVQYSDRIYEED